MQDLWRCAHATSPPGRGCPDRVLTRGVTRRCFAGLVPAAEGRNENDCGRAEAEASQLPLRTPPGAHRGRVAPRSTAAATPRSPPRTIRGVSFPATRLRRLRRTDAL